MISYFSSVELDESRSNVCKCAFDARVVCEAKEGVEMTNRWDRTQTGFPAMLVPMDKFQRRSESANMSSFDDYVLVLLACEHMLTCLCFF